MIIWAYCQKWQLDHREVIEINILDPSYVIDHIHPYSATQLLAGHIPDIVSFILARIDP